MSKKTTVRAGDKAPSLNLPDIEGQGHVLEKAVAQGPVLLAFFKAECPTCQYAFPFLERLHRQFVSRGVSVWGISQDGERDSREFAAECHVTFPTLIDARPYEVSNRYGVAYTPTLFLVGRDGKVELEGEGFSKRDLLEVQKKLASDLSTQPEDLFLPGERVPEYKPG